MIFISKPPDPFSPYFRTRANTKTQEHRDAYNGDSLAYHSRGKNRKKLPIDDSIYKAGEATKAALIEAIYTDGAVYSQEEKEVGKCYFCEYRLSKGGLHVEHYRPKNGSMQSRGSQENYPGYYWLAYSWDNLILACYDCNRIKDTIFPLVDDDMRVRSYLHNDDLINEEPLLINPTGDDPRDHIYFVDDLPMPLSQNGIESRKGSETIKLLKLDYGEDSNERAFLREKRSDLLFGLRFKRKFFEKNRESDDIETQKMVEEARVYLEKAKRRGSKFSSMAQDFLADWEP